MIDEITTFVCYGYMSDELSLNSHKGIIAICDDCKCIRLLKFQDYRDLCKSCTLKRRNVTEKHKKIVSKFHTGRKRSEETKRKISVAVSGKNNYNWNPKKTDEERKNDRSYPEYYEWRSAIFERDSYTCQKCREIGGKLNAHHIENYANNPTLRTTFSNGVTLCENCHKNLHHHFGYKTTKEQFIEFIGK